ncbi:uracil-DNA glycosylase family protein [Spirochaeta isovalerica]|uniref:Uracil-DNA glycosylase n=1 Tax=Spirochaeta isovalerica TaxID=150 RepID=A0A841REN1_9SPIO|nr:uracil-DNA glycosylase family protein [Spirochaeta isovalerica]MBB6480802.1 uracil-DNA glycosylase [Spirochaeta isovalerica]
MNQRQIFTEYWKILDDFEDYMNGGFSVEKGEIPHFKLQLKVDLPKDPGECRACSLHEHNELRAPYPSGEKKKLLIVNRSLPRALAEEGRHFTADENLFLSKWLEAIDLELERDCAVIARVSCPVKDPAKPGSEALGACLPYFERTLKAVEPIAVLQLGLDEEGSLAGRTGDIPLFRTYHPSDVLINGKLKRPVWESLKQLKGALVGR